MNARSWVLLGSLFPGARAGWWLMLCLVGAGCWRGSVPDPDLSAAPTRVLVLRYGHEAGEVRQGILAAMEKRRWLNERESRSEIVAHLMKKDVVVRVTLEYSADRIAITGVKALGAGRNYEKWLSNLEQSIFAELRESAPSARVTSQPGPAPLVAATEAPSPVEAPPVVPEAPPAPAVDPVTGLALTWANRASFFIGARGGLAFPPGAVGLAPNVAIELGVAPPTGFGFGVRAMWMSSPPGVPFLGLKPAQYGFGALADFRYSIETIDPLIIYPTIGVGFLAGPERVTMRNAVLPLLNIGVGAKMKFGNLYATFEFGVSGFTIPYVGIAVGFDGDSKITKEAERLRLASKTAPVPVPTATP